MTSPTPSATAPQSAGGLPLAVTAYLLWGLLPIYLRLVHQVPPLEFIGWRTLATVPICMAILLARRQLGGLLAVLANRRLMASLLASSLLIGTNWVFYVSAIQHGHVFATSLGYYINPLLNVLLGTLFLGEKLSRLQWVAVALAGVGVGFLALAGGDKDALTMLAIAMGLALTFGGYGLVRKLTPVTALNGLTVEVLILAAPAACLLLYVAQSPAGLYAGQSLPISLLVALSGLVTAVPLMMFAAAARRMDFSTLGFIQFLTPTIVFVVGITVFHEKLRPVQLTCFVVIWAAIAVFCWDLFARRKG